MATDSKGRRLHRTFTDEFEAEAARSVLDEGKTVGQVARDLDLTETGLRAEGRARAEVRLVLRQPWCFPHVDLSVAARRTDWRSSLFWNMGPVFVRLLPQLRRLAPENLLLARAEATAHYWSTIRRLLGSRATLRALSALGSAPPEAVASPGKGVLPR